MAGPYRISSGIQTDAGAADQRVMAGIEHKAGLGNSGPEARRGIRGNGRATDRRSMARASNRATGQAGQDAYANRLLKLIPAEVVTLYMSGIGVIPPIDKVAMVGWALICLVSVVFVRAMGSRDKENGRGAQWGAVTISTISFGIWVFISPGPVAAYGLAVPWAGTLAIMLWTFVVPYFYKPD